MSGWLRFLLLFVGGTLVLASAVLAFPGSPAYEKSFTHEATLDDFPDDDSHVAYYQDLSEREQNLVDRALDGETVLIPAHHDLPPERVFHTDRSELYQFEKDRYYDTDHTAGRAGVISFVLGIGTLAVLLWDERRR